MGSGKDNAKESADMVLVDDNFATIVKGVEEGRSIYANMQAFISYLISCNIGEVLAVFFSTVMGFPSILSAMHLLWLNLVTDGPPATALSFNPPDKNILTQKPRPVDEEIITGPLLTRYVVTGIYIGLVTVVIFAHSFQLQGISIHDLSHWSSCESWHSNSADAKTCEVVFGGEALRCQEHYR